MESTNRKYVEYINDDGERYTKDRVPPIVDEIELLKLRVRLGDMNFIRLLQMV